MKKNKIIIHPLFYLFMIISLLTGYFKDLFTIMTIIIIHELGHIFMAIKYKWNIKKIIILPFGGITIFEEDINRPIKEELFILIMGPLFQMIGYFILNIFFKNNMLTNYHYLILIFNLLPIIPLDGSKLINLIGDYLFPYIKSYKYNIYISVISLIAIIIFLSMNSFNLICYIIIFFLLLEIIRKYLQLEMTFNRFILERYQKHYIFKKRKIINKINLREMKRDFTHLFYSKNKCYTEKEIIAKRFDFKGKLW